MPAAIGVGGMLTAVLAGPVRHVSRHGLAMIAAGPGRTCSNLPWISRALTALVATLLLTASMTAGSLETEATIAA